MRRKTRKIICTAVIVGALDNWASLNLDNAVMASRIVAPGSAACTTAGCGSPPARHSRSAARRQSAATLPGTRSRSAPTASSSDAAAPRSRVASSLSPPAIGTSPRRVKGTAAKPHDRRVRRGNATGSARVPKRPTAWGRAVARGWITWWTVASAQRLSVVRPGNRGCGYGTSTGAGALTWPLVTAMRRDCGARRRRRRDAAVDPDSSLDRPPRRGSRAASRAVRRSQ